MSKRRTKINSSRASVESHLAAAASEILGSSEERGQAEPQESRELSMKRVAAAVDSILTAFEASSAAERGTPEPGERRRGGRGEERKELCRSFGVGSRSFCVSLEERRSGSATGPEDDQQAVSSDDDTAEDEDGGVAAAADETPHSWRVCGKSFDGKGLLMKHVEKHDEEFERRCGARAEPLESGADSKRHLQTHRDTRRNCDVCGETFPSMRAKETHARSHSGNTATRSRGKCPDEAGLAVSPERDPTTSGEQTAFSCKVCGTDFSTTSESRRHARRHSQPTERNKHRVFSSFSLTPTHSCKVCGIAFHNKGNSSRHTETHLNHPELMCGVCGERAESSESSQLHIQSHRVISKVCDICGDNIRDMEIHMRTHSGQKPFRCKDCCKDFPRKSSSERHSMSHAGQRPYICEFCGKTFVDRAVLRRHIKSHTGGKHRIYGCEVCGKKFTMRQHSDVHKRIHTGEKPFPCKVCGKTFRQIGNSDSHMRIHTGEKPFVCSSCGKTFRQKISLETHERFHKKDKAFVCQDCGKGFVQKIDSKRHMSTHTGEKPFACGMCEKSYQEKRSSESHMKVHAGGRGARDSAGMSNPKQQEDVQPEFIQS